MPEAAHAKSGLTGRGEHAGAGADRRGRMGGSFLCHGGWHHVRAHATSYDMTSDPFLCLTCPSPAATAELARRLAPRLRAGDVVLLSGPVGAGKSHFARALIQSRLLALGRLEDVPSPTFTIVQSYDLDSVELWHADLYRLGSSAECEELGLFEAFETAICLVEWPDRLGPDTPPGALRLALAPQEDARRLCFSSDSPAWQARLDRLGVT